MKLISKLLGIAENEEKDKFLYGATDVGKERSANEDYFRSIPEKGLYIVADGMGGHNAGDIASINATKMVDAYFTLKLLKKLRRDERSVQENLVKSLLNAHVEILRMSKRTPAYEGMGCTIVAALIHGNSLHVGHVGDARAYVCSRSGLKLLTTDHSYVMELVKRGKLTIEEARVSPLKNRLNQAIGASVDITPDYNHYHLQDGDRLLLCSDGLWDMIPDEQIYYTLMLDRPAKKLCEALVDMANNAGGHDNITALVVIHRQEPEDFKKPDTAEIDTAGEYSVVFRNPEEG